MTPLRILTSDRVFTRNTGGNTTYAKALYRMLTAQGHQHVMVAPPVRARGRMRPVAYAAWEGAGMLKEARLHRADLVHYPADTGRVIRRGECPVVATIHGVASAHGVRIRGRLEEQLWRSRVHALSRAADRVITVSSSSSADLQRFFSIPEDKIAVIPHGVDLRSFRRIDDDESAALLEPLGLPRDFVLFVGNIEPRKNVAELVAAFEDSRLANAARLVVVGRLAREANRHTRLFAAATNTLYLGPLPRAQIVALMNSCRAFVFPSRYEGFGLPVLEAMACGAPVIASRAAAIAEVAGDAAFYLDSPSRKHISEAALAVLRDPVLAARLRSAGYARSAIYSWERAAKQHVDVFRAAVSGDAFEPSLSGVGNGSGTSGSAAACSRLG